MLDYKVMRNALKASPEKINLKHFTEDFYSIFCVAYATKDWTPVFSTDFYNLDGSSYCAFLEVFNASLPRWRLTFGKYDAFHWPIDIMRIYINEATEEAAKAQGQRMLEQYGADYVEVIKVK